MDSRYDSLVKGQAGGTVADGAEARIALERFPRQPHIDQVRALSQVNGWRTTAYLAFQWAVIVGCLTLAVRVPHWAVYLGCGLVVATRMQAIGVLLHDGVHHLLYRNRLVNDVVCDLFIAFPLGMSTTLYRKTHFRHHRFTNTELDQDLVAQVEDDPEWSRWPKGRGEFVGVVLRSLLGLNAHLAWPLFKHWSPMVNIRRPVDVDFPLRSRVLFVLSLIGVYTAIGWGFWTSPWATLTVMLVYSVPGLTVLNLINRLRTTAEHIGTERTRELDSTRSIVPSVLDRLTIAPYGVSYHLEHHLFPSVPGHNLARLHRELMEDPDFRERAHVTHGYSGVVRELLSPDVVVLPPSPVGEGEGSRT